jgi:hypothetical protein
MLIEAQPCSKPLVFQVLLVPRLLRRKHSGLALE